jgi:hypothetical protein
MRLRTMFVGVASAGFLGVISPACGSSSGPDFATEIAPYGFSSTCNDCIQTNCLTDFNTCYADTVCNTLETCAAHCFTKLTKAEIDNGDGLTCVSNCTTPKGSTPPADATALDGCLAASCETACGG